MLQWTQEPTMFFSLIKVRFVKAHPTACFCCAIFTSSSALLTKNFICGTSFAKYCVALFLLHFSPSQKYPNKWDDYY